MANTKLRPTPALSGNPLCGALENLEKREGRNVITLLEWIAKIAFAALAA
jgi:hypothetical protein